MGEESRTYGKCLKFGNTKFLVVGIFNVFISKARQEAFKHCGCFRASLTSTVSLRTLLDQSVMKP